MVRFVMLDENVNEGVTVDGVSVMMFVHVAPAGTVMPVSTKPEFPTLKVVEVQGAPTANEDVLFGPAGKATVSAPLITAVLLGLAIVMVRSALSVGERTAPLLTVTETVPIADTGGGDDVLLLSPPPPPPPPPPQALSATTALAIIRG